MKTNNKIIEILIWVVTVAPFIYLALIWNQVPEQIETHFDLNGQVNGTQSKTTFTVLMGILQLFIYAALRYAPGLSVFSNQQPANYDRLRLGVTLFISGLMSWLLYRSVTGPTGNDARIIWMAVMGLLVLLGNYLPSLRPNFFVGVRTPWTLFNETVWRKTHQMTGRLWMVGGVLGILLLILVPADWQLGTTFILLTILVVVPVVYSYWEFRNQKKLA